jgi:uncharacterized protein (TIGR03435 family)
MRSASTCLLSGVLVLSLWSQTKAPAFEVASIKLVSGRTGDAALLHMETNAARVVYTNVTLEFLISLAYRISDKQISGIPGAVESASYDVAATLPANAAREQIPIMMQGLLADRLKLAVRLGQSTEAAYDLTVAPKGAKLEHSKPEAKSMGQIVPGQMISNNRPMEAICGMLSRVVGRPVVDKTGLRGLFDFTLTWGTDETGPSIFTTLQEQHGLKLQPSKTVVDSLTVIHAERVPTEN